MEKLRYKNIFESITDDKAEAAYLLFRADLMLVLRECFEAKGWSQGDIMGALEITQPRVSELLTGKVTKCSSDKLIGYLAKLGYQFKPSYGALKGSKLPIRCDVSSYNE